MPNKTTHIAALVMTFIATCGVTFAQNANSFDRIVDVNIEAQPLASALLEFSRQAGVQVVSPGALVTDSKTPGVHGKMSLSEALTRLLQGTSLSFHAAGANTIGLDPAGSQTSMQSEGSNPSAAEREAAAQAGLQEIVVTAQKREERLEDVPVPVTVLNATNLVENNKVLLRDYFDEIPGINVMPNFVATQNLAVRGITTGGLSTPTVGVTIDDVPFGGSSGSHGNHVPDIDPGDLARVEVLRGPQGTLYGADSMGGLVKFVTVDPSTAQYSGRLEAGASTVYNGTQPGLNMRGSANIPLSDRLAVRVSAFGREDPGYINNPVYHLDGVNDSVSEGGRVSALWQATDNISLKLSALYQHTREGGLDEVDVQPGLTGLQQGYIPGVGIIDTTWQAYSAVLKARMGGIELTSLTGYNVNHETDSLDWGFTFTPAVERIFGVSGVPYHEGDEVRKVVQEVRLSIPLGARLEWLIGGYYTHESDSSFFYATGENVATGQVAGTFWNFTPVQPDRFEEYAGFTNLTYHFTDSFDIQVGGRESHLKTALAQTIQTGPFVNGGPVIGPAESSAANSFTYLVTPRLKLSSGLMIYGRFASGYRPGTPNLPVPGQPRQSDPDKTKTYEVGLKGDLLDRLLSVDASVYYIDWSNIQIELTDPISHLVYNTNGSRAKSQGVELSMTARPAPGLELRGWVSYDDAVLTQSFPSNSSTYGVAGDRLPLSSRYSGNFSARQEFPLSSDLTGFVGGEVSYVGNRIGVFGTTLAPQRQFFPAYTKVDLRTGVKCGSWTTNLYVNNVADERALVNGGTGYFYPAARIYITPRTVGLSVVKTF